MKKKTKIALGGIIALFGVIALSSCTKSFCSNSDLSRAMYAYEPGITRYEEGTQTLSKDNFELKNYLSH